MKAAIKLNTFPFAIRGGGTHDLPSIQIRVKIPLGEHESVVNRVMLGILSW